MSVDHLPLMRKLPQGVINPGSPTYPRNLQAQPGTVGVLRLGKGRRAEVTIYDLKTLQPYPELTIRLR